MLISFARTSLGLCIGAIVVVESFGEVRELWLTRARTYKESTTTTSVYR